jgi:hypothetical protein
MRSDSYHDNWQKLRKKPRYRLEHDCLLDVREPNLAHITRADGSMMVREIESLRLGFGYDGAAITPLDGLFDS